MGIDISGGMIVGANADDISVPECVDCDLYEYAEEHGMERFSKHYDADDSYCVYGFTVSDVSVDDINQEWLNKIKNLGEKFKDLTGVDAELIGMQNVW